MLSSIVTSPFFAAALALFGLAVALWLASLALRDSSIVDVFWGPLIAFGVLVAYFVAGGGTPRAQLSLLLVLIWAARLALYLGWRNVGHGEDPRYLAFRQRFGRRYWLISLGYVFLLQASIAWVVVLPLLAAVSAPPTALGLLDVLGILLFVFGFLFETVADLQLARFRRDRGNRGAVLETGLWRYTRHPNYFGEFCLWWGLGLIGLAAGAWWALAGPALLSYLLLRVSGVTMLERTIVDRRPAYARYRRQTNAFFPGKPKLSAG